MEKLRVVDGEPTNSALLSIGMSIADSTSYEIQRLYDNGTLGKDLNRRGASGDWLKAGDDVADKVVRELWPELEKQGIGCMYVYSEEEGVYKIGDPEKGGFFIVLDPLDGSNNIEEGMSSPPAVSVSLGMGRMSDISLDGLFEPISVGVVRDLCNYTGYYAIKGEGAFSYDAVRKNKRKMETSNTKDIRASSKIGYDLDGGKSEVSQLKRISVLETVVKETIETLQEDEKDKFKLCQRRLGSSILDFCKVAGKGYDSFLSIGGRMRYHDLAAAQLILKEAGGDFTSWIATAGKGDCHKGADFIRHIFERSEDPEKVVKILKDTKYYAVGSATEQLQDTLMAFVKKHKLI